MTKYVYKNADTKEIIEREFSMNGKIPEAIEIKGKIFNRFFGSTTSVHIPYQWGHEPNIDYKKSPSGRKHFF
jgi:hypothetical protein